MTKLYILVFLAIITVSLGLPDITEKLPGKLRENVKNAELKVTTPAVESDDEKEPVDVKVSDEEEDEDEEDVDVDEESDESDESDELDKLYELEEPKDQDKVAAKEAEKATQDKSDKLNKKVSDEIQDEIAKISEHQSENIQPAGERLKRAHGLINYLVKIAPEVEAEIFRKQLL